MSIAVLSFQLGHSTVGIMELDWQLLELYGEIQDLQQQGNMVSDLINQVDDIQEMPGQQGRLYNYHVIMPEAHSAPVVDAAGNPIPGVPKRHYAPWSYSRLVPRNKRTGAVIPHLVVREKDLGIDIDRNPANNAVVPGYVKATKRQMKSHLKRLLQRIKNKEKQITIKKDKLEVRKKMLEGMKQRAKQGLGKAIQDFFTPIGGR